MVFVAAVSAHREPALQCVNISSLTVCHLQCRPPASARRSHIHSAAIVTRLFTLRQFSSFSLTSKSTFGLVFDLHGGKCSNALNIKNLYKQLHNYHFNNEAVKSEQCYVAIIFPRMNGRTHICRNKCREVLAMVDFFTFNHDLRNKSLFT